MITFLQALWNSGVFLFTLAAILLWVFLLFASLFVVFASDWKDWPFKIGGVLGLVLWMAVTNYVGENRIEPKDYVYPKRALLLKQAEKP